VTLAIPIFSACRIPPQVTLWCKATSRQASDSHGQVRMLVSNDITLSLAIEAIKAQP